MSMLRVFPAALALFALAAPTTLAAPARTGELKAIGDTYEWADNRNVNSTGYDYAGQLFDMCEDPGFPCDDTLVHITTEGPVLLSWEGHDTGLVRPDIDLYLYTSDSTGTEGDLYAAAETPEPDEYLTAEVEPGWYLLRTAYWSGLMNNYTAKASIAEIPPVEEDF